MKNLITEEKLSDAAEAAYTNAINTINCSRALRSPVIQQVCIDIVESELPGFSGAGGYITFDHGVVAARVGSMNPDILLHAKTPDAVGFDGTHVGYELTRTFYCPQYGDCEVKVSIWDRQPLPNEDIELLVAIGKVEKNDYTSSYNTVMCGI